MSGSARRLCAGGEHTLESINELVEQRGKTSPARFELLRRGLLMNTKIVY